MNTASRILLAIVTCLLIALAVVQTVGVAKQEGAGAAVGGAAVLAAILLGLYRLAKVGMRFLNRYGEARRLALVGGLSAEELRSLPGYGKVVRGFAEAVLILLLILGAVFVLSVVGMGATELARESRGIGNVLLVALAILCFIAALLVVAYLLARLATTRTRRRTAERIVIGQIAAVVRQNLPLATALALAAESERGWPRVHLSRIAKLIAQGMPLSQAVRIGYPDCSGMVLSLIVAGEQGGQLPAALEQAENHLIEQARRGERGDDPVWPYLLIIMSLVALIVGGIMVTVVPKFQEIFSDFDVLMPAMTITLIKISDWMVHYSILTVWPTLVIGFVALYLSFRPRRVPRPAWSSRLADWVRWHLPGWRTMQFSEGMAAMLGVMRIAVRAGMDLGQAARLATGVDANWLLRPRMARFADMLTAGTTPKEAAMRARLGEVTAVALAAGQRSGDMDGALRYAAEYHAALMSRVWLIIRNLIWPVCTLLMATVVGFVVVAFFMPLVTLINSVSM